MSAAWPEQACLPRCAPGDREAAEGRTAAAGGLVNRLSVGRPSVFLRRSGSFGAARKTPAYRDVAEPDKRVRGATQGCPSLRRARDRHCGRTAVSADSPVRRDPVPALTPRRPAPRSGYSPSFAGTPRRS
jgi:hypothetical protein